MYIPAPKFLVKNGTTSQNVGIFPVETRSHGSFRQHRFLHNHDHPSYVELLNSQTESTMHTRSAAKRRNLQWTSQRENLLGSDEAKLVLPDISGAIRLDDTTFARSLYCDLAAESSIDAFLEKSRSYNTKERRWKLPQPQNYTRLFLDREFYITPVRNVILAILKHFRSGVINGGRRRVVDAHSTELQHCEGDIATSHKSRPSLVITAEGPSFQLPPVDSSGQKAPLKVGWSNIASCIEVAISEDDEELPRVKEQLVRAAIYARQIFIHQPNRRFVRVLTLTGHHLRLFHFDRSGAQYTPPIDIHDDPHTFVRLVLGLSSPNECDIGLDTSIRWSIVNGSKVAGSLTTRRASDGQETVYPLIWMEPFFCRPNICGRSTTCWSVLHKDTGEELLVKSSWRSEDRTSEHIYLEEAVGVAGVVQMVSYEPDRAQTKELRGLGNAAPPGFENRIESRVVVKRCGPSLVKFTSPIQVLCALRDAIAGHRELVKKGTLHRDVSTQNILLGKPGAEPGDRGVLIDFDLATHSRGDEASPLADWAIGHRFYQSAMVLSSSRALHRLPHSHLDDLESFFYVFTDIIHSYDQGGDSRDIGEDLKLWLENEGPLVGMLKRAFLLEDPLHQSITSRWPKPLLDVFYALRKFLQPIARQKMIFTDDTPEERAEGWKALMLDVDKHYDFFLQKFDEGIAALEMAEAEQALVARAATSVLPEPVSKGFRKTLKRSSEEIDTESQPALKRTKCECPAPPE